MRYVTIDKSNRQLPFAVTIHPLRGMFNRHIDTTDFLTHEEAKRWASKLGIRVWDRITNPEYPNWPEMDI